MISKRNNAITITRALLCVTVILLLVACIAGCATTADTGNKSEGMAESHFRNQMADDGVKEIAVKKDLVLESPVEVNGTKVLYGEGSITAVGDAWTGNEYLMVVSSGAELTVKGSVCINADGITGGIHAAQGAVWCIEEAACVNNASAEAANTLVEGAFHMNGGTMSGARGNNVYNKGEVTVSAGEIVGSGTKCAGIYSEGILTQDGGSIRDAYNNVTVLSGSFTFNGGDNRDSVRDGIYVAEGAKLSVTAKSATITGSGVRGIYLCGEAAIGGITLNSSGDSLVKISQTGTLNLSGGTLTDSGYHSIENAGKMVMTGGTVSNSYNCGIVNTGTLELTGGSLLDNVKNKALLNKHDGKATVSGEAVMFSGNRFALANEDTATLELSGAGILLTTGTNVYAYDGTVYIHDISLGASGSNNVRIYNAAVTMTNVEVLGNSSSGSATTHGILLEGGVLNATDVTIKNTTGYGIRNKGGLITAENLLISKSIKAGGINNAVQDHTGAPGIADIKNLTIEQIRYNNVVVDGGTLTVTNGKFMASGTNNTKITAGTLTLKQVEIHGNQPDVDGTNHAVYSTGGTLVAENVQISGGKVTGLRVNGETSVIKGTNVTIQDNTKYGIDLTEGRINIDGLTMNGNYYNITTNGGSIKLCNANLGATVSNNVRINDGGVVDLQNVVVKGHTPDHLKNVHALFVSEGKLTGEKITVENVSDVGLRVKGGTADIKGLTVEDAGADGVWINSGKATIHDLVVKKAGSAGISATETAEITVIGGSINNTVSHGAKSEDEATLTLQDITVSIATTDGRHAVLAQGGDIQLNNVKVTGLEGNTTGFGIRINRDTSHVSGKGIHIADVNAGISATAGTADVFAMTTQNMAAHSVYATNTAKLVISDSEFGVTGSNNVKAEHEGSITLNHTVIQGTVKNHGLMAENGGYLYGKDITVRNTAGCAVRVKCGDTGNYVEIDGLVTQNIGTHNAYINKDKDASNVGSIVIKNGDLGCTGTHSVLADAGDLILSNTKLQGHLRDTADNIHAIYVCDQVQKVNLENVTVLDAAGDALRISAGDVVATGFTSGKTGRYGIWTDGGKLTAQNTTVSGSKIGVHVTGGAVVLGGIDISGSGAESIKVTGGELTVNGYADGKMSQIATSMDVNVRSMGTGVVRLDHVNILAPADQQKNNVLAKEGGKIYVTDSTLTGGNYSVLVENNGYAELIDVAIHESVKDGIRVNAADGKVVAKNVQIVSPVRYGISADKGSVELSGELTVTGKDQKSSAIFVCNSGKVTTADSAQVTLTGTEHGICVESGGAVTLGNLTIDQCAQNGFMMKSGTAVLNGANISADISNIVVSGGELTVNGYADGSKSQIGASTKDNIVATDGGIVRLDHVNVQESAANNIVTTGGAVYVTDSTVTGGNYSILAQTAGYAQLTNVTITDPVKDGIRVNAADGKVVAKNVQIVSPVRYGISADKGSVELSGELTVTGKDQKSSAIFVCNSGKVTTADSAQVALTGTEHGICVESGGAVTLGNLTIDQCAQNGFMMKSGTAVLNGANISADISNIVVSGGELTVNGYADGSKSQIGASTKDNIVATDGGIVRLDHVNVQESAANNIVTTGGAVYVTDSTVTGGNYSILAQTAGYAQLTNVTITNPVKDGIRVNAADGKVVAKNVQIVSPVRYGISADKGSVELSGELTVTGKDQKSSAIFVCNSGKVTAADGAQVALTGTEHGICVESGGAVTLGNLTIDQCAQNGFMMKSGTAVLNGVNISADISNIVVSGGELTVNGYADGSKSQIGTSAEDNVKATGAGVIRLNSVNVLASAKNNVVAIDGGTVYMTEAAVTGGNHSVLADKNGKVYLNQVSLTASATSGIRANHSGSVVEATDVVIDGANTGLSIKCGTVQISNLTIRNTKAVGIDVRQGDSDANVTLSNLVTENCGTNAVYTSGANAKLTIDGATVSNDGSDHVIYLNGGPMVLHDVAVKATLAAGRYELFSGAGWLTVGGAMDADIYIATDPGRVIKVNKALTGKNLVVDWKNAPTGNALEFTDADMLHASKDSVALGSVQGADKVLKYDEKTAILEVPEIYTTVTGWSELSTMVSAMTSGSYMNYRIAGDPSDWAVSSTLTIPEGVQVKLSADENTPAIVVDTGVSPFTLGNNTVLTLENLVVGGTADAKAAHIIVPGNATLNLSNTTLQYFEGEKGGAVHVNCGTLTADGATFANNSNSTNWGGAVGIWGGTAQISNSLFTGNTSKYSGGAIINYKADGGSLGGTKDNTAGDLSLTNCVFTNNTTLEHGGAIAAWANGTTTITGCVFGDENDAAKGNRAAKNGGAIHVQESHTMVITDCRFFGNATATSANTFGGAICAKSSVKVQVSDCTFKNNASKYGGAINIDKAGGMSIERSTFAGNKTEVSGGEGGAIRNCATTTVTDCTFTDNIATGNGGAIILFETATTQISGSSFTGNSGAQGGAISVGTGHSLTLRDVVCENNKTTGAFGSNTTWGYGDIRVADNTSKGAVTICGKIVATIWNNQAHSIQIADALTEGSHVVIDWRLGKLSANKIGVVFGSEEIMNASKAFIQLGVDAAATEGWSFRYATTDPWQAILVKE